MIKCSYWRYISFGNLNFTLLISNNIWPKFWFIRDLNVAVLYLDSYGRPAKLNVVISSWTAKQCKEEASVCDLVPHLSQSCTCRQTWSSKSDPAGPWGVPEAGVAAAGQTGCWFERERMAWWSRRAESDRMTSACWPSFCHTAPWWRKRPSRTVSRLEQREPWSHWLFTV